MPTPLVCSLSFINNCWAVFAGVRPNRNIRVLKKLAVGEADMVMGEARAVEGGEDFGAGFSSMLLVDGVVVFFWPISSRHANPKSPIFTCIVSLIKNMLPGLSILGTSH